MTSGGFRSWPFGTLLILVLAGAVYALMLANIQFHAGGGDAVVGEAIMEMFLLLVLWVLLALLLTAGGVAGRMPRWAAIALVFLHPLSGVAVFAAIDMCSRMMPLAAAFVVVLPALTALYALWARLTGLHTALPQRPTSAAALGGIAALSVLALATAASF
jgi:hypothetical protein